MHILLIEDDTKTGEYLKKGLGESGYNVDWTQLALTACTWPCIRPMT